MLQSNNRLKLAIPFTGMKTPVVQHLGALAFGIFMVYAVGFLPTDAVHNAAHDVRHMFAFPCH